MIYNQVKYWESVAGKKEFHTAFQLEEFIKHVTVDSKILDVGCGYGRILTLLKENGYTDLTGCDISQNMIDKALKLHPELTIIKNDPEKLPFDDDTFDAITLNAVLTTIVMNIDQYNFMEEIKRVIKIGGILYINDFLLNSDQRNIDRYDEFKEKYGYGTFQLPDGGLVRHHTMDHISALTKDFEEQVYEPVIFKTMNNNRSNGFYYVGKLITKDRDE